MAFPHCKIKTTTSTFQKELFRNRRIQFPYRRKKAGRLT